MSRMASSFALGSWLGFLAVAGLGEVCHALGWPTLFGIALETSGGRSALMAVVLLGTATGLAVALALLQSRCENLVRRGELTAFAAIGVCSAMVGAAAIFGAPFAHVFDRLDLAFWAVGLSVLALAFDAAVFEPADEEDEIAYRRSLLLIEASSRAAARRRNDLRGER